ncbi:hypothetical protein Q4595_30700, partial [Wenyingzhuangia sp. 1_MG-2023]|nr:hypothetical protein [Wenyingzhuangia sp. 1_MG-2023]
GITLAGSQRRAGIRAQFPYTHHGFQTGECNVVKQWISILMLLMMTGMAQAELVIEVTQGKQSAIPIAVVPFEWQGEG